MCAQFYALPDYTAKFSWKVTKYPWMPCLTEAQLFTQVLSCVPTCPLPPCYCPRIQAIRVEYSRLETVWGKQFFCWMHMFLHGDTIVVATWPIVGISSLLSTIINFPSGQPPHDFWFQHTCLLSQSTLKPASSIFQTCAGCECQAFSDISLKVSSIKDLKDWSIVQIMLRGCPYQNPNSKGVWTLGFWTCFWSPPR